MPYRSNYAFVVQEISPNRKEHVLFVTDSTKGARGLGYMDGCMDPKWTRPGKNPSLLLVFPVPVWLFALDYAIKNMTMIATGIGKIQAMGDVFFIMMKNGLCLWSARDDLEGT